MSLMNRLQSMWSPKKEKKMSSISNFDKETLGGRNYLGGMGIMGIDPATSSYRSSIDASQMFAHNQTLRSAPMMYDAPTAPSAYTNLMETANLLDVSDDSIHRVIDEELSEYLRSSQVSVTKAIARLNILKNSIALAVLDPEEVGRMETVKITGDNDIVSFQHENALLNRVIGSVNSNVYIATTGYFLATDRSKFFTTLKKIKPALDYLRGDTTNFIIGINLIAEMDELT